MDYIEEKYVSGRMTGQIKIHHKEDFQVACKSAQFTALQNSASAHHGPQ